MPATQNQAPDLWPVDLPRVTTYPMLRKAVRMWAQGASDVQIAGWLNIRPATVAHFRQSDGWKQVAFSMRKELDFDLEAAFGRMGAKALEQLENRLDYGDFYITRTGERARRPLSAEQLSKITNTLMTHRVHVRDMVDGVSTKAENEKAVRSSLDIIANALRAAVGSGLTTTPPQSVIDVTPTAAIPTPADS